MPIQRRKAHALDLKIGHVLRLNKDACLVSLLTLTLTLTVTLSMTLTLTLARTLTLTLTLTQL